MVRTFIFIVVMCIISAGELKAGEVTEKILTDGVTERVYTDGKHTIVVNGTELNDLTPKPEPFPNSVNDIDNKRGYILYHRSASDQVFRFSSPIAEERTCKLSTDVSLGEKRHMQFAIYALRDLGNVDVSVGVLTRDGGETLPKETVLVRPVRLGLWRNYWNPWYQEAPKLIDASGTLVEAIKGQSRQIWLAVDTPRSVKSGEYKGSLFIRPEKGEPAELKISINVLDFELKEGMWWGVYYYSGFNENTPRDFADMKAHGVNSMLICPPGHVEPVLERDGNTVKISFPQTDLAMAELKKQGFNRPVAYYPRFLSSRILQMFNRVDGQKFKAYDYYGQAAVDFKAKDFPDDLKPVLQDVFRQMVKHAKEANWPEILWYFDDEPGAVDLPGHMIPLEWSLLEYRLFKEVFPHEQTLCTIYKLGVYKALSCIDVCVGDLWRFDNEFMNYVKTNGSQAWGIRFLCQYNTYNFPRHFAGIGIEKMGLTGFTEWTYYGAPLYKPYDQLLNKEGCQYAFVDEQGRLLTTISWEAVQEGIYDARYIVTLRSLIEKARLSQDADHKAIADKGEKTLQQVMAKIPAIPSVLNESEMDNMRKILADSIQQFVKAGIY
ncbi:MAG: DUF6067 family protein [Planctomycetaceae bacterium]|nr:DUF6067 family protein [Planctomycetaceae bacterium]